MGVVTWIPIDYPTTATTTTKGAVAVLKYSQNPERRWDARGLVVHNTLGRSQMHHAHGKGVSSFL